MKPSPTSSTLWVLFTCNLLAGAAEFQAFEGDGFGDWKVEGEAFGLSPVHGKLDGLNQTFTQFANEAFALSAHGGMDATGALISPKFKIQNDYLKFLIAGGDQAGKTAVQLVVDGKVTMEATGKKSGAFTDVTWNLQALKSKEAEIRIIDDAKGKWGFIAADHFILTNYANEKFPSPTSKGKPHAPGLVQTPALAGALIPGGTSLQVQATFEKDKIKSPTALTFDEKGNVYVAETHRFRHGIEDDRNHLYWYHDDLQAIKVEDRRALHKKWESKLSHEYMTEVSEVIRRLSDTDGDGKMDESKVFAEGFNDVLDGTAAGVFFYDGALYFACIPKIYKIFDKNGDGVSDKTEVVEEGFGVRISLSGHDLNGFTLGPDGRIYGTVGDRGFSMITKEGKTYHYPNEGALFRFDPDGTGFELVHTGLRNPKEIAFDTYGNAFTVDNNSDQGDAARVVYLVEGGDSGWQMEHQAMHTFHRQIGLEERPPSRWMDEKMWELRNEFQPAYILPPAAYLSSGPSGLTYHPGAGFLESEKGRFLICDYKGGAASSGIWSFEMAPEGAGMSMTDARKFQWGVAATDVEYSFDGRVFITDFVNGWKSHDEGRLLSLDAGENLYLAEETREAAKLIATGFDQRSSEELVALLNHPDSRVRLRAQIAITRKADAIATFQRAILSDQEMTRIHGIWGMGIVARRGALPTPQGEFSSVPQTEELREKATAALIPLLKDTSPEIRVQTLRALGDAPISGDSLPLAAMLKDSSARVQFEAAIAIGKLKGKSHVEAVKEFLVENDNRDLYLRHAGIYALEHAGSSPEEIGDLAKHESPAVRLAAVVTLRRMLSDKVKQFINDGDPSVQDEAIRAVDDLDMVELRPVVATLLDKLQGREWTPFMLRRLVHSAYRVGTADTFTSLLEVIGNEELPLEVREEALRLVRNWEEPYPVDQVSGKWRPLAPRKVDSIKSHMVSTLPKLFKGDNLMLIGALELIEIYDLDVATVDDASLLKIISNQEIPSEARSAALKLYIDRKPEGLSELLVQVAEDSADDLALNALTGLAKTSPEKAIGLLAKTITSENMYRAQAAWGILAGINGDQAAELILVHLDKLKTANGISPTAIELLAAAELRSEDKIKQALKELHQHFATAEQPFAKFNIALQGGDAENGLSLFKSHPAGQCMRCHQFEDKKGAPGGDAGPNLAGIGKIHDRQYLLEAMINPGAIIAPGYGITSVVFKNGANLVGNLIEETPEELLVSTPEQTWSVKRSDIASFTPPVSAMPPMAQLLQPSELRDLVAWLDSLKKKSKTPAAPEAVVLDPATLLKAN